MAHKLLVPAIPFEAPMRCYFVKSIAIVGALVLSSGIAKAAIISGTYAVVGSNFASSSGTPPFASITESFTITFNNAITVSQQTAGISLNSSTITPTSTLGFTYIAGADTLIVGGLAATVATADPASTDFALFISNASSLTSFGITSISYSVGTGAVFAARTTAKPAAVPEPASLALLGTAAAFGLSRSRRRNKF